MSRTFANHSQEGAEADSEATAISGVVDAADTGQEEKAANIVVAAAEGARTEVTARDSAWAAVLRKAHGVSDHYSYP